MRHTFATVYGGLGLLLAIPAFISVIQHVWDVGLVAYLSDFVTFYRALLHPVFEFLYAPIRPILQQWSINIPPWVQDLHALSIAGGGLWVRANNAAAEVDQEFIERGDRDYLGFTLKSMIPAFFGLGLFVLVLTIAIAPLILAATVKTILDGDHVDLEDSALQLVLQFLAIAAGVFAFYFVNALSA